MTAKEARKYAKEQLSVIEGENKKLFYEILGLIKVSIMMDAAKAHIIIDMPPKQVIAWLESNPYGYETAVVRSGPNETELKISWSEDGIKQYGNDK